MKVPYGDGTEFQGNGAHYCTANIYVGRSLSTRINHAHQKIQTISLTLHKTISHSTAIHHKMACKSTVLH